MRGRERLREREKEVASHSLGSGQNISTPGWWLSILQQQHVDQDFLIPASLFPSSLLHDGI